MAVRGAASLARPGGDGASVRCRPRTLPDMAAAARDSAGLVGDSPPMRALKDALSRVAASDAPVLLWGETGTGKGATARALHARSPRARAPFVVFDCAAVSPALVESELFGHERGAFTGAAARRRGCLERAGGGTLLLDELSDLPLELQPRLLRALEDRTFSRVGGHESLRLRARVVAALREDAWGAVQSGRLRADLYFRLSALTLCLPPLRERTEDVPALVDAFAGEPLWDALAAPLQSELLAHPWPGNVRELRNIVQRLQCLPGEAPLAGMRLPPGPHLLPVDLRAPWKTAREQLLAAFERAYLDRLLSASSGNLAQAARDAGLDRSHLYVLLRKHGQGRAR
jgi:DNA-binding NtrC family response regulator